MIIGMRPGSAPPIQETLEQSRRLVVEFCRLELELGNAFLDRVDVSPRSAGHRESIEHARVALDTVAHILARSVLGEDGTRSLQPQLRLLKKRITRYDADRPIG